MWFRSYVLNILFCPPHWCLFEFQELTPCQAPQVLQPAHSCLNLLWWTTLFCHRDAPASVTACATTSTRMQPLPLPAHSTSTCKIAVSSFINIHNWRISASPCVDLRFCVQGTQQCPRRPRWGVRLHLCAQQTHSQPEEEDQAVWRAFWTGEAL